MEVVRLLIPAVVRQAQRQVVPRMATPVLMLEVTQAPCRTDTALSQSPVEVVMEREPLMATALVAMVAMVMALVTLAMALALRTEEAAMAVVTVPVVVTAMVLATALATAVMGCSLGLALVARQAGGSCFRRRDSEGIPPINQK